jgi:hypothetical protein
MAPISSLSHRILATAILAVIFAVPIAAFAQGTKKLADTFDERFPAQQSPTRPSSEQAPALAPAEPAPMQRPTVGDEAQKNYSRDVQPNSRAESRQPKNIATSTPTAGKRPPLRVVVVPRSFIDAGTEVQPGERKLLDYAFPRTHTAMHAVTNTGGRVGWHNSPLPGPLFPGRGPW